MENGPDPVPIMSSECGRLNPTEVCIKQLSRISVILKAAKQIEKSAFKVTRHGVASNEAVNMNFAPCGARNDHPRSSNELCSCGPGCGHWRNNEYDRPAPLAEGHPRNWKL